VEAASIRATLSLTRRRGWENGVVRVSAVVVGVDSNLPCLGVAFIAVEVGAAAAVLKACDGAGIKLGEPTYLRGICTAAVVELPWYRSFADLVEPRIRAYFGRYLGDVKKFNGLDLEWERIDFAVPEAGLLKKRLRFERLPATVAEDLESLVWSWSREYQHRYNWSFKVAVGRICRAVSLLSRRNAVLVKLENLRGIKRKNVPHLRRWSWIYLRLGNQHRCNIRLQNAKNHHSKLHYQFSIFQQYHLHSKNNNL